MESEEIDETNLRCRSNSSPASFQIFMQRSAKELMKEWLFLRSQLLKCLGKRRTFRLPPIDLFI